VRTHSFLTGRWQNAADETVPCIIVKVRSRVGHSSPIQAGLILACLWHDNNYRVRLQASFTIRYGAFPIRTKGAQ
jgi:hypothetical protein